MDILRFDPPRLLAGLGAKHIFMKIIDSSINSLIVSSFTPNKNVVDPVRNKVVQQTDLNAIILCMWKILMRELIILIVSVGALPAAAVLYLIHTDSWSLGLLYLTRQLLLGANEIVGSPITLWFKVFSPYLIIQTIRALFWSKRSLAGAKWANLYFALLLAGLGAWSLRQVWDLFFLMYILGDVPGELMQLLKLEGHHLLIFLVAIFLAIHCFRTFLNPKRNKPR